MSVDSRGNDASRIRFAPEGAVYIAPIPKSGTKPVPPTSCGTKGVAPTGYTACGWLDESGVTITPEISSEPIKVWQSAVPVLYNVKEASFKLKATFLETNISTTELFFGAKWEKATEKDGNGGWKEIPGTYRLNLSSTPQLEEISLVVDWSQANVQYRAVIERAMVADRGAIQLTRNEANKYELTIDALDSSGRLGYVLTTDNLRGDTAPPTPVATALLESASVVQGASVYLSGTGFKPSSPITVSTGSSSITAAPVQSSSNGDFRVTLAVADTCPVGRYEIKAGDGTAEVSAGSLAVEKKPAV